MLWRLHEEAPELLNSLKTVRRLASKNLPLNPIYSPRAVPSVETITTVAREMVKA